MVTGMDLRPSAATDAAAWDVAATVCDPEIPVLTIEDLGVLREAHVAPSGRVEVTITPTYSGCPAMDAIRDDVTTALRPWIRAVSREDLGNLTRLPGGQVAQEQPPMTMRPWRMVARTRLGR